MNTEAREKQLILSVLRIIASMPADAACSQRTIAGKLDIALGLVNSSMRQCIHNGLVIATKNHHKSYSYQLTAAGIDTLRKLSESDVNSALSFYRTARRAYVELFASFGASKSICFLGVSDLLPIAAGVAAANGHTELYFFEPRSGQEMSLTKDLNINQTQEIAQDCALIASAIDLQEFMLALEAAGRKIGDVNIPNLSEIIGLLELV
jgi:hypothetical protein